MNTQDLARMVLKTLALQKEYFRTRSASKLSECKDAERRLERACDEILNPPGADLFKEAT